MYIHLNRYLDKIQKGIDTGSSFSVTTKKDDGSKVERYYAPIKAVNQTWWAASALNKTDLERNTIILVVFMIDLECKKKEGFCGKSFNSGF